MFLENPTVVYCLYFNCKEGDTSDSAIPSDAIKMVEEIVSRFSYEVKVATLTFKKLLCKEKVAKTPNVPEVPEDPVLGDPRLLWAVRTVRHGDVNWKNELILYRQPDAVVLAWKVSRSDIRIDLASRDQRLANELQQRLANELQQRLANELQQRLANEIQQLTADELQKSLADERQESLADELLSGTNATSDDEWSEADTRWKVTTTSGLKSVFGAVRIYELKASSPKDCQLIDALKRLPERRDRRGQPFAFLSEPGHEIVAQRFGRDIAPIILLEPAWICHFDQWLILCESEPAEKRCTALLVQDKIDQSPPILLYFYNMMKARCVDHLVRGRKDNIEKYWEKIGGIIDKLTAESPANKFQDIQEELTKLSKEAFDQTISETSIRVAVFNCRSFRVEHIIPQPESRWGFGGPSCLDEDVRTLETAMFQAEVAVRVADLVLKQLATKVDARRVEAAIRTNKNEKDRQEQGERFSHELHLLEVFVISVYVVELAAHFSEGERQAGPFGIGITWHMALLFPTGIVAALLVLGRISAQTNTGIGTQPFGARVRRMFGGRLFLFILALYCLALFAGILLAFKAEKKEADQDSSERIESPTVKFETPRSKH